MVDPEKVERKLGELEEYLKGLEEKKGCSIEQYKRDQDLQDIVERRFEKAIQSCTDIASHVVSSESFREPENYGDNFQILAEEDVLSSDVAEKMVEMTGFRNVLAHDYAEIKNDRVYHQLQSLKKFHKFSEEMLEFLKRDSGEDKNG